jgi:phosphoribosylaminoimidazole-succinocarboxamide synthase
MTMVNDKVLTEIKLKGITPFKEGKVRSVYDMGDALLIVVTDRISAFDYILPNGIPFKGMVLTKLSEYWFDFTEDIVENHIITTDVEKYPASLKPFADCLRGRSMLVKKARLVPIECVVRGYLAGSGWKEYQTSGTICGRKLEEGYWESCKLTEPIFTPSTKAEEGHDENISIARMYDLAGKEIGEKLEEYSLKIYKKCSEKALKSGIIIADTKFEFGMYEGKMIVIDEMLTPDSSRFWPQASYAPGRPQDSFDKQYVRDYLESIAWNKQPPVPTLPDEVVRKTSEKYLEAYKRITGQSLV